MISLRFAPMIRVSTEKQAKQGESLRTQKSQIEQVVKQMGGSVPDHCWQYSGQEHATPDLERMKYNKLLRDASKGLFDAVIVADLSRWSRDNRLSKEGLNILSSNGIRFFILNEELDLMSPDASLRIGMMTEFNEFQARIQKQKSIMNRIERAKRGLPAAGKLPYGRTFNKTTGKWGVDEEKQKNIEVAAQMYLEGEPMLKISEILEMNNSNLHKILTTRCGDKWEQRFRDKQHGIDEIVQTDIPSLLSVETINNIQIKAKSNTTYTHGKIIHSYLLSRMIFCGHCGYAMFGQTNHTSKSYYRHARKRKSPCCSDGLYLSARDIENAAMVIIIKNMMDEVGFQKALERAQPNESVKKDLICKFETLRQALVKIGRKKERLLDEIENGTISPDDIRGRMDSLKEKERDINSELDSINSELQSYPTVAQINNAHKQIKNILKPSQQMDEKQLAQLKRREEMTNGLLLGMLKDDYKSFRRLWEMTFDDKRALLQYLFAGTDLHGKRYGVYVTKLENGKWRFQINGIIGSHLIGFSPMSDKSARAELGIEDNNIDPYTGEVLTMSSERHAHHRLRLYQ